MAIKSTMQWEVQAGGTASDNNGGGFDDTYGVPGTDYTYGANQQVISWLSSGGTYTNDIAITSATYSVVTSASRNFVAADVGNVIHLTAGTNVLAGWYQITSVSSNAATLDSLATTGTDATAGSGYLGGALASPGGLGAVLSAVSVSGQISWIKSGTTYTATSSTANVSGGVWSSLTGSAANDRIVVSGYTTTRWDNGQATFDISAITGANAFDINGATTSPQYVMNIIVEDDLGAGNTAFHMETGAYESTVNCVADSCEIGFEGGRTTRCKSIDCTTGFSSTESSLCYSQGCTLGFSALSIGRHVIFCIANGCTNGFQNPNFGNLINCLAYNCSANGFDRTDAYQATYINCLAAGCGGYGFDTNNDDALFACSAWHNTSGNTNVTPRINDDFVEINGTDVDDIFIDAANADFRPTNTTDRGDLLRGAGWSPYGQTSGNLDIGAVQHADPAPFFNTRPNSLLRR